MPNLSLRGEVTFGLCHGLNVSPQNSYVETLTPKDDGIRRWGLWEVLRCEAGTLMNGIRALIKEAPEPSLTPLTT